MPQDVLQWLEEQAVPALHVIPHPPQFELSVVSFAQ